MRNFLRNKSEDKFKNAAVRFKHILSHDEYLSDYMDTLLIKVDSDCNVIDGKDIKELKLIENIFSVYYSKSKFYGTLTIKNNGADTVLWSINYINLLSIKQRIELFELICSFLQYKFFHQVLNNANLEEAQKDRYSARDSEKRVALHNKPDAEKRMKNIALILSQRKTNKLFRFFLITSVLLANVSFDKYSIEDNLKRPFNYNAVSDEDRRYLSFFTSVMTVIPLAKDMLKFNKFFMDGYNAEIKVLNALFSKIVYDTNLSMHNSKQLYSLRQNVVVRDLDYVFKASAVVASYVNSQRIEKIIEDGLFNTQPKNIFCLPNSIYKLCFSEIALEGSYAPAVEIGSVKIEEDKEYFDRLTKTFHALDNEILCANVLSDDVLSEVNPYLVKLFDLNLLSHLVKHDMSKFFEVVSFLDDLAGHIEGYRTFYSSQTEEMGKIFKASRSGSFSFDEEPSISFTYGFVVAVAQWAQDEESLPFRMWINLYDDELFFTDGNNAKQNTMSNL